MIGGAHGKKRSEAEQKAFEERAEKMGDAYKAADVLSAAGLKYDDKRVKSNRDIFKIIRAEGDESKKKLAIHQLINKEVFSQEEMVENLAKMGDEGLVQYAKKVQKEKESSAALMEQARQFSENNKRAEAFIGLLDKTVSSYNTLYEASLKVGASGVNFNKIFGESISATKEIIGLYDFKLDQLRQMESTIASLGEGADPIEGRLKGMKEGSGAEERKFTEDEAEKAAKLINKIRELNIAKSKSSDTGERSEYQKQIDDLTRVNEEILRGSNLTEKQRDSVRDLVKFTQVYNGELNKAGLQQARSAVETEKVAKSQQLVTLEGQKAGAVHDSTITILQKERAVVESQEKFVEAQALGMAASYEMRKRTYDLTVAERMENEKAIGAQARALSDSLLREDSAGVLLKAAGSEKNIRESLFDVTKMTAIQEKLRAIGTEDSNAQATALADSYSQIAERQRSIMDLKTKELELTMRMREGFLDVINEMTTGQDLVTSTMPDMNRGIMSLIEIGKDMQGIDFDGIMRLGFIGKEGGPGGAIMPRYGAGGLTGMGTPAPGIAKYLERLSGMGAIPPGGGGLISGPQARRSGWYGTNEPMTYGSGAGPHMGGAYPVRFGMHRGGKLPGSPAGKDNTIIAAETGEYVVNSGATAANLPLLEAINSSRGALKMYKGGLIPGFQNGGIVDQSEEEIAEDVKRYYNRESERAYQRSVGSFLNYRDLFHHGVNVAKKNVSEESEIRDTARRVFSSEYEGSNFYFKYIKPQAIMGEIAGRPSSRQDAIAFAATQYNERHGTDLSPREFVKMRREEDVANETLARVREEEARAEAARAKEQAWAASQAKWDKFDVKSQLSEEQMKWALRRANYDMPPGTDIKGVIENPNSTVAEIREAKGHLREAAYYFAEEDRKWRASSPVHKFANNLIETNPKLAKYRKLGPLKRRDAVDNFIKKYNKIYGETIKRYQGLISDKDATPETKEKIQKWIANMNAAASSKDPKKFANLMNFLRRQGRKMEEEKRMVASKRRRAERSRVREEASEEESGPLKIRGINEESWGGSGQLDARGRVIPKEERPDTRLTATEKSSLRGIREGSWGGGYSRNARGGNIPIMERGAAISDKERAELIRSGINPESFYSGGPILNKDTQGMQMGNMSAQFSGGFRIANLYLGGKVIAQDATGGTDLGLEQMDKQVRMLGA
jgi:hypothetical protein